MTGLDYYHARYYDPVAGVFLSADTAQGNLQGMNPYAYVGGNPETWSDPTGRYIVGLGGEHGYVVPDDNGGKTIELFYANGWEVVHHVNAQGNVDAANGHPANGKTAHCVTWCGDVKDSGKEMQGLFSLGIGLGTSALGLGALRAGSVQPGLSWLSAGISDLLYAIRLLATNHTDVNPHFLLMLDSVKFLADAGQTLLILANAGQLITKMGVKPFLDKVGAVGKMINGLIDGQAISGKELISNLSSVVGIGNQLFSPQSGVVFPLVADLSNVQSDLNAIPAYDSNSF